MKLILLFTIIIALCCLNRKKNIIISNPQYEVLKNMPRTETFYTQGLLFDKDNNLIESGGLYGESVLVKMEYPSLNIIKKVKLKENLFGEGIGICKDNYLYQLTWKERKILKYIFPDLDFNPTCRFRHV